MAKIAELPVCSAAGKDWTVAEMNDPSDRFKNGCKGSCLDVFEHLVDGGVQIWFFAQSLANSCYLAQTL